MSSALPRRFPDPLPRTGPETWCFAVQAEASPGLMPRVLELFAKRNLVPARWHSALTPGSTEVFMDVQVAQIDGELAAYVASCMRQLVGVTTVLVSRKG